MQNRRKFSVSLALSLLLISSLLLIGSIGLQETAFGDGGSVTNVDTGTFYSSIQSAIDDASAGNTLVVYDSYSSSNENFPIEVSEDDLTIKAAENDNPEVDANGDATSTFIITADGIPIDGLTISNSFDSAATGTEVYGIKSTGAVTGLVIKNCDVIDVPSVSDYNGYGIYLVGADAKVYRNTISGNQTYGLYFDPDSTGRTLDARQNYWGDPSGPRKLAMDEDPGRGLGDRVSDNVDYDPWFAQRRWY